MFLIIQNDPHCPPGSCQEILAEAGHPFRVLHAYREEPFPDPVQLSGVIVLGGEMSVYETEAYPYLEGVLGFLARLLEAGTPLLGICLGGQLLARAAGGEVSSPSLHGEKGVCRVELSRDGVHDPLFAGVSPEFVTFQLHDDSFTPPPGAALLASSPVCPAQAFRLGGAAYGLQFHPEVDGAIVSDWGGLSVPPADFLPGFLQAEAPFAAASRAIIGNFVALCASRSIP
jgi:GMP synthase (glutamine-hydrolysing)